MRSYIVYFSERGVKRETRKRISSDYPFMVNRDGKLPVIEVRDLKKYYRETQAVDGISFSVEGGEIFGLLGPNGAGKTTTIEIIEGMREPDAGQVQVRSARSFPLLLSRQDPQHR